MLKRYRKRFWLGILFIAVASTALAVVSMGPKGITEAATDSEDAAGMAASISSERKASTVSAEAAKTTQGSNNARLEAELITLHPSGFEPSEISRPAGPFILALQNRSGLEQLLLQVNRSSGARMREVEMRRERSDWNGVVELPVGSYTLTELNNPDWTFRLTITAR